MFILTTPWYSYSPAWCCIGCGYWLCTSGEEGREVGVNGGWFAAQLLVLAVVLLILALEGMGDWACEDPIGAGAIDTLAMDGMAGVVGVTGVGGADVPFANVHVPLAQWYLRPFGFK